MCRACTLAELGTGGHIGSLLPIAQDLPEEEDGDVGQINGAIQGMRPKESKVFIEY